MPVAEITSPIEAPLLMLRNAKTSSPRSNAWTYLFYSMATNMSQIQCAKTWARIAYIQANLILIEHVLRAGQKRVYAVRAEHFFYLREKKLGVPMAHDIYLVETKPG